MKKTPWFSAEVRPVRRGVYERRFPSGTIKFAKWDGRKWHTGYGVDPLWAASENNVSGYQCDFGDPDWRGLTTKDGK